MHPRRFPFFRLFDVRDLGQLVIFDLDQLQSFFRDCGIIGQNCGHRIADVAHFVDRHDRLVFIGGAVLVVEGLDMVAREGGDHTAQRLRLRRVYLHKPRMGMRASENSCVSHARQLNIGVVNCLAGDFFNAIDPVRTGARNRKSFVRCHRCICGEQSPDDLATARRNELLADFRTVLFGKIKIAERAMKIHSRPQHMRIDDENFLALRTGNFYRLTHDSPSLQFDDWRTCRNTTETPRHSIDLRVSIVNFVNCYAQYVVRSIGMCCSTSPGTNSSNLMRSIASSGHLETGENGRSNGLVASTLMPEVLISSTSDGSRKLPRKSGCRMET